MDQKSPHGNKEQSFALLPPELKGQNKSIGAHDRIPPNPANSRHRRTVTLTGGAFRNSPLDSSLRYYSRPIGVKGRRRLRESSSLWRR
jgi:hypothetical protein